MRIYTTALAVAHLSSSAFAHPSLVRHDHPHGPSALLGLDALALVGLGIGAAALALWLARRGR